MFASRIVSRGLVAKHVLPTPGLRQGAFSKATFVKNDAPYMAGVKHITTKTKIKRAVSAINAPGAGQTMAATSVFGAGLAFLKANPFSSQVSIASMKTGLADILVQKNIEKRDQVDWRRAGLFFAFGGLYLGIFQWYVYVVGFQRLFPAMAKFCDQSLRDKLRNKAGLKALFGQIGLDFVFIQPFMYFPIFYAFKTVVEPEIPQGQTRLQVAKDNWQQNFWVDNLGMCGFWFPADLIIYSVPMWLRLPLNHGISFAWCCILSLFRGGDEEEAEELFTPSA